MCEFDTEFDQVWDEHFCPDCAGDGVAEYIDHPESWGEDCPSLENHMITCPNCGGTGFRKDCKYG